MTVLYVANRSTSEPSGRTWTLVSSKWCEASRPRTSAFERSHDRATLPSRSVPLVVCALPEKGEGGGGIARGAREEGAREGERGGDRERGIEVPGARHHAVGGG